MPDFMGCAQRQRRLQDMDYERNGTRHRHRVAPHPPLSTSQRLQSEQARAQLVAWTRRGVGHCLRRKLNNPPVHKDLLTPPKGTASDKPLAPALRMLGRKGWRERTQRLDILGPACFFSGPSLRLHFTSLRACFCCALRISSSMQIKKR